MGFWDDFWPGFWANALATLLGVAAGVPIAFAIDRKVRERGAATQEQAEANRLSRIVHSLRSAIEANVQALTILDEALRNDGVRLTIGFTVAVWDAVRLDAVRLLDDPSLQVQLARYFESLDELARLQRHLIDVKFGVAAAMTDAGKVQSRLFEIAGNGTRSLIDQSSTLLAALAAKEEAARSATRNVS